MYSRQRKIYKQCTRKKNSLLPSFRRCIRPLLLIFFSAHSANAQINFGELQKLMSEEKKEIVVYITSKYCTYCLMQDAQIRKNRQLQQRLNNDFYFVKVIAESDSAIVFNGKVYVNPKPEDPYQMNDFVNVYGKNEAGNVGYPLWLYFDKDYKLMLRFYGLMPPKNILKVLNEIEKAAKVP